MNRDPLVDLPFRSASAAFCLHALRLYLDSLPDEIETLPLHAAKYSERHARAWKNAIQLALSTPLNTLLLRARGSLPPRCCNPPRTRCSHHV